MKFFLFKRVASTECLGVFSGQTALDAYRRLMISEGYVTRDGAVCHVREVPLGVEAVELPSCSECGRPYGAVGGWR